MGYPYRISRGTSRPLGATCSSEGVNFSLYSASATAVELLLFDHFSATRPRQIVRLEGRHHRNFDYWHAFVHGVGSGQIYAYRVYGAFEPEAGQRFNSKKVLLDPYARGIVYGYNWDRRAAEHDADNTHSSMKCIVVDPSTYDWEGVEPPRLDPTKRVLYELHVRGFTKHDSSRVHHPGTFDGLVEKIPYLKSLGVTTVELLPVFQFDEQDAIVVNPDTGEHLIDFWGYNPIGFFAPHRGYYIEDWSDMAYTTGFRDMVKEFHRAGIEVVLDVVFNHTTEGDHRGPTISFRGIENRSYYLLEQHDASRYANYSGTGNTFNCNHPIARRMILDSLRYWVDVMHVDGFRFDLASILARDEDGSPLDAPPLTWEIESDPSLQRVTLIAEAWDAAGLYQVGAFPGERWAEWNGQFRDDIRRFWRGDAGLVGLLATRMMGSPDLYSSNGRSPLQCVNFVTAHDGFTLNDLVSYNHKHNAANGEDSRDGANENYSRNFGVEGPTEDPAIEAARKRQIKNLMATLFLAQGTPMMLAGDEFRRTQGGNNNPWCQDNEISWVDWALLEEHADIARFTRRLLDLRRRHPSLRRDLFLLGFEADPMMDPPGYTRVRWHGREPNAPDWSEDNRFLCYELTESRDDVALVILINGHDDPVRCMLPELAGDCHWMLALDTAKPSPMDAPMSGSEVSVDASSLILDARSVVVLAQSPGEKSTEGLLPW